MISRATPDGRVSLEDGHLILTTNGQRTKHKLENQDDYGRFLKQYFDVTFQEEQGQDDR
jgi:arylamine N-acetyltransferase